MSCYFQVGEEEIWNPSNSLARLFLSQAEVLSNFVGRESGLGEIIEDECEVDPQIFTGFVDSLVNEYQDSNNQALRSLIHGFTTVALVLVERMGGSVQSLKPEYSNMWSVAKSAQERSMPRG
ncbi:DUF6086 family protein [Streptomyces longispororuber]|uniref:DUF6086 family protein n=1 Tax=Streptomyces longispororuber TaxID=68230 RepID=UPI0033FE24D3